MATATSIATTTSIATRTAISTLTVRIHTCSNEGWYPDGEGGGYMGYRGQGEHTIAGEGRRTTLHKSEEYNTKT
jgi:hypothetical protein